MFRFSPAKDPHGHLIVATQGIAVSLLTAVLIAVQHGRIVGFGLMESAVQTFLFATIAAVSLFVSLIPHGHGKDTCRGGIVVDAWTKIVGIIAAVLAAWMGISDEAVDLTPYRYLFAFLALFVTMMIVAAAAHALIRMRQA